MVSNSLRIY